ncbi:MAG TPA: cardiolipin synthase [Gammaproteobacteria bacterium]|nr:cardiolipin synthase [Gammaproteobacteria bacterium]
MSQEDLQIYAILALTLHWATVIGLSLRVIMRRRPVGVLLAWLAIILSIPLLGVLFYLFVGENRISSKYVKRSRGIDERYEQWRQSLFTHATVDWSGASPDSCSLHRQGETVFGFPALRGNRVQLLTDYEAIFRSIIDAINACRSTCHLEFYIWYPGGLADELVDTVINAARRGVVCRVLVDALGSKTFLDGDVPRRFAEAGVRLGVSLPIGIFSTLFSRADLRNHRKIAVIDGRIGYTGSQNLVDPRYFKQEEGVGQWVDAMLRIEGPAVEALGGIFLQDWEINTGVSLTMLEESHDVVPVEERGGVALQAMPSGPARKPLAILQLLLSTFYAARRELIVTTPYFVPDDALLIALTSAAHRGVAVTIVLPEKNDSRLVDYASRAVFEDLLEAGVTIAAFRGGLLHTKSVTVDGEFCLFGSVNLDMRSLWLNFEISLMVYNREVTAQIRDLQAEYIRDADLLDAATWRQRPFSTRLLENVTHLAAPLL